MKRELPWNDRSIDLLRDDERRIAASRWAGRADAELQASRCFRYLATTLPKVGVAPELAAIATRATDDEERHAELCHRVACRYAETDLEQPSLRSGNEPTRRDISAEDALTLYVVGVSCFSETMGSAVLEANLTTTTAPLARAVLRQLFADEIHHARLGWSFLAADTSRRDTALRWLPQLRDEALALWHSEGDFPSTPGLIAHGCPDWHTVETTARDAVDDIALAGFRYLTAKR